MEAFKEKSVGVLLAAGATVCVLSLLLGFAFAGGGIFHATATRNPITNQITDMGDSKLVPFTLLGFATGLALIGGAIGFGLWQHGTRHEGATKVCANVRVIARYGYTRDWNLLTEQYQFEEADNPTYYLRLETSHGVVGEYECRPETYFAAGEGMTGEAMLRGKWCGRFAPYIGIPSELPRA